MAFLDNAGVERLWQHIMGRLGRKVDAVAGKGLSTNDYTDEDKSLLNETAAAIGDINAILDSI